MVHWYHRYYGIYCNSKIVYVEDMMAYIVPERWRGYKKGSRRAGPITPKAGGVSKSLVFGIVILMGTLYYFFG